MHNCLVKMCSLCIDMNVAFLSNSTRSSVVYTVRHRDWNPTTAVSEPAERSLSNNPVIIGRHLCIATSRNKANKTFSAMTYMIQNVMENREFIGKKNSEQKTRRVTSGSWPIG